MRGALALAASALTGLAGVIASLNGDADLVPFFVGLTFMGGLEAWASYPPFGGGRRVLARAVALVWLLAAIWIGVLLLMYVTVWQGSSRPPPGPESIYAGLTATWYYLLGIYGGVLLTIADGFGPERWFSGATAHLAQPAGDRAAS